IGNPTISILMDQRLIGLAQVTSGQSERRYFNNLMVGRSGEAPAPQTLPVHSQPDLQLARIVRRRRLTSVSKQRTDCRDVEPVRNIEDLERCVKIQTLTQWNVAANADIVEHRPGRDPGIAS